MRNLNYLISSLFLSCIFSLSLQAQHTDPNLISVCDSIDYDYFFKHLKYLSSDQLEGRGAGSSGYAKAADYVANELAANGLMPFADSSSYFQRVELVKASMKQDSFNLEIAKESKLITADYGSNLSVVLSPKYERVNEKQEMVFVGYGNIIPQKNINDYDGIDVKGKTVIVALGGPKSIEHPDFNDRNAKFNNAVSQGASGLILFYPKANILQNIIFNKVHGFLSQEMLSLADHSIETLVGSVDLKLMFFAKKGFIREIFKLNGLSLHEELSNIAKGQNSSKELASTLKCSYALNTESIISQNVLALWPGIDPELKNEYVVFGAHLDGLGIGKAIKGDSIYNGMVDNASGVSALLSISQSFTRLAQAPKRSIIFACYTAEENGLLGSAYFANRNPVQNGKIVANINVDMLAQSIETIDMAPLGYSHSTLSEAADFAAKLMNLKIDDNKQAETDYIARSDQISFIKTGVPSLFIAGGQTALNPRINGKKVFDKWMKKTYSSPFDDLHQEYSEKAFLTAIKFDFLTTYYVANVLQEIRWNTDSWLYKKYVLDK